jgi:GAF domain-containing protein
MRAYLGVPVHAEDGQPVGTLAVLDRRAREFTPAEQHMLERYARAVEQLIQQRRS